MNADVGPGPDVTVDVRHQPGDDVPTRHALSSEQTNQPVARTVDWLLRRPDPTVSTGQLLAAAGCPRRDGVWPGQRGGGGGI